MRIISVPVTVVQTAVNAKPELGMQILQWPARCACCGELNQNSTLDLRHNVHASGATCSPRWARRVYLSIPWPGASP